MPRDRPAHLVLHRRALDEFIDQIIASTRRYGSDLSVVMFDLDNFKKINDTYGHQAGDHVLKAASRTVLAAIRKCDYSSLRRGGICPDHAGNEAGTGRGGGRPASGG